MDSSRWEDITAIRPGGTVVHVAMHRSRRSAAFLALILVAAVGSAALAGCGVVRPAGGPAARPPDPTFHIVVWNLARRSVDVNYDGTGSSSGAATVGGAAACEATVFDSMIADTWELKVDGRHVVGTAERPDLSAARGVRELTVEIDITAEGTVRIRSIHPGAAPGADHLALPCPGGSPTA